MRNRAAILAGLAALALFAWPLPGIVAHTSNEPTVLGRYALDWFTFGTAYLLLVALVLAANVWLWLAISRGRIDRWAERARRFLLGRPLLAALALAAVLVSGRLAWLLVLRRTAAVQMPGMAQAISFGPAAMAAVWVALGGAFEGESAAGRERARSRSALWVLVPVLLLATFLRFYRLDFQSLWFDELATWWLAHYDTLAEFWAHSLRTPPWLGHYNWPAGDFIVSFLAMRAFGDTEFGLRFLPALAGVLSVAAVFALGRRLYDRETGAVAAALLAVAPTPLSYSQEARVYSLLILLAALSTYFWIDLVRGVGRDSPLPPRRAARYLLSALGIAYLHYYGILLVALQAFGAAVEAAYRPRRLVTLAWLYGLWLLGYAPWLPKLWLDFYNREEFWIWQPEKFTVEFPRFLVFLLDSTGLLWYLAGLFALSLVLSVIRALGDRHMPRLRLSLRSPGLLLLLWLAVPFSVVYVKSILSQPVLSYRYLLISLPPLYLLLARGITRLPLPRSVCMGVGGALAVALLANLVLASGYYTTLTKEQFRQATAYLVAHDERLDGESIIIGWAGDYRYDPNVYWIYNYYFEQMEGDLRIDVGAGETEDIPRVARALRERDPRYVWLIAGHGTPEPGFIQYLNRELEPVHLEEFSNVDVRLYEARGEDTRACRNPRASEGG